MIAPIIRDKNTTTLRRGRFFLSLRGGGGQSAFFGSEHWDNFSGQPGPRGRGLTRVDTEDEGGPRPRPL